MAEAKKGLTDDGKVFHFSVGAVIERDGKYLLIDRAVEPFGFAGPAGHVDEGEEPDSAIIREVQEETGLSVDNTKLLIEEFNATNACHDGIVGHHWYIYSCEASGEARQNSESKSMGWFTADEIKQLNLEPVWKYWFEKLGVI